VFKCFLVLMTILSLHTCSVNKIHAEVNFKPEDANAGIIYGDNHAFFLTPPKGWVLDNFSGVSQGLHAVFYRLGSSWSDAKSVMYANTVSKGVQGDETIDKVIEGDVSRFRATSPNLSVISTAPSITGDRKEAIVKLFFGDRYSNHEAVAYIDERKVVVIIVLSSRSKEEFEASLPAFKELVGSYRFFTEDVRIDK